MSQAEEKGGACPITAPLPKRVVAALAGAAGAARRAGRHARSIKEGICVFYDLGLTQINVLQEKEQTKSSESKLTEKPPDVLLIKVRQLTAAEEGEERNFFSLRETKSQSWKASDDLSDSHNEGKEQGYATPSEQTAARNPKNLKLQICAPHQIKAEKKPVFSCGLCTYTSLRISSLNCHVRPHSEEKHHVCYLCLKPFHTAIHPHNPVNALTGTRPYKCSDCEMAFVTSGELPQHKRYEHILEKPFKCLVRGCSSVEAGLNSTRRTLLVRAAAKEDVDCNDALITCLLHNDRDHLFISNKLF
ncbi:transcriptional repressor CTCFL [Phaenicophaeus curvirostris]|uniref:transcriptional repressor CTCFL n=1 Tax=Phaenicophaeus curvirostris TaxID=33595 RepID=UPI0037F0D1A9